jgi:hypothetical protein
MDPAKIEVSRRRDGSNSETKPANEFMALPQGFQYSVQGRNDPAECEFGWFLLGG